MAGAVRDDSYESAALPVLEDGGIRFERLSDLDCAKRWPPINFDGVSWSVYEPDSGFPAARRGCEAIFMHSSNPVANIIANRMDGTTVKEQRLQG